MSLESGTAHALLADQAYKLGNVGQWGMKGLLNALRELGGFRPGNIVKRVVASATSTATIVKAAAGVCYGMRVINLSASDVIVKVTDASDNLQILTVKCKARVSSTVPVDAEAYAYGRNAASSSPGVGVDAATNIRVQAYLASDGTTTAAAGVTVEVYTD